VLRTALECCCHSSTKKVTHGLLGIGFIPVLVPHTSFLPVGTGLIRRQNSAVSAPFLSRFGNVLDARRCRFQFKTALSTELSCPRKRVLNLGRVPVTVRGVPVTRVT
jgi:hypothetical protein